MCACAMVVSPMMRLHGKGDRTLLMLLSLQSVDFELVKREIVLPWPDLIKSALKSREVLLFAYCHAGLGTAEEVL